jgi:group I intron endonuclease
MRCIYKIVIDNGKYYIGSAQNLNCRKNTHLRQLERRKHHNNILQAIYNKGHNLNFIVIEEVTGNLFEREQSYLNLCVGIDPLCVNISQVAGGGRLYTPTKETKAKELMTKQLTGRWGRNPNLLEAQKLAVKANTGAKRTDKSKKLMSESHKKFLAENPGANNAKLHKGRQNRWNKYCKPFILENIKTGEKYGPYKRQKEVEFINSVSISQMYSKQKDECKGFRLVFL